MAEYEAICSHCGKKTTVYLYHSSDHVAPYEVLCDDCYCDFSADDWQEYRARVASMAQENGKDL